MNTLVLLLASNLAAGGDPVRVIQYSPAPTPTVISSDNSWNGQAQESRPRLFPRLRALFSRRSQSSDQVPVDSYPSYPRGATVPSPATSQIISPAPVSSPSVYTGPTGPAIAAPSAAAAPSASAPQRMPAGNPF
jgi:hypothetical protein